MTSLETTVEEHLLQIEWFEFDSISLVEFILKFNPMQSHRMQETFQHIHDQQYTKGDSSKDEEANHDSERVVGTDRGDHTFLPEDMC